MSTFPLSYSRRIAAFCQESADECTRLFHGATTHLAERSRSVSDVLRGGDHADAESRGASEVREALDGAGGAGAGRDAGSAGGHADRPDYQIAHLSPSRPLPARKSIDHMNLDIDPSRRFVDPWGSPYMGVPRELFLMDRHGRFSTTWTENASHENLYKLYESPDQGPAAFGTWFISAGRLQEVQPSSGSFLTASRDPKFLAQLWHGLSPWVDPGRVEFDAFTLRDIQGALWQQGPGVRMPSVEDMIHRNGANADHYLKGAGDFFWTRATDARAHDDGLSIDMSIGLVRAGNSSVTVDIGPVGSDGIRQASLTNFDGGSSPDLARTALGRVHRQLSPWFDNSGVRWSPATWALLS